MDSLGKEEIDLRAQRERYLVDAAGDAFRAIIPQLRAKGFSLVEYLGSLTLLALLSYKAELLRNEELQRETEMLRLPPFLGGVIRTRGPFEKRGDRFLGERDMVSMETETEDGVWYPEFVIVRFVAWPDILGAIMSRDVGYLDTLGLFNKERPPVAIEAVCGQIVEVREASLMEAVEKAVDVWRKNLEDLFEEGKVPVLLVPKIIRQ